MQLGFVLFLEVHAPFFVRPNIYVVLLFHLGSSHRVCKGIEKKLGVPGCGVLNQPLGG